MRTNKFILYGLFSINFLTGLAALLSMYTNIRSSRPDVLVLKKEPSVLLSDSARHTYLLTFDAVELIHIRKPYLLIGTDTLEYQTILFSGKLLYIPTRPAVWQNYWAGLLGKSEPGKDEQRWKIAQQKWQAFVQPEMDSLARLKNANTISLENQLCHALVQTILSNPTQTFYVHNNRLESASTLRKWATAQADLVQVQEPDTSGQALPASGWLLTLVLLSIGLVGLIYTGFLKPVTSLEDIVPPVVDSADALDKPEQVMANEQPAFDQEQEATRHYIQCFAKRYGDFYQMLENLPEPITDERTKMQIKRQLVEMALHMQSFTRAYILAKMQRPQGEPNLLLITNNWAVSQLDPQSYKVFTKDPYVTNKRYRLLQPILTELNIGDLEGALLHDVYLPAEFLVQS